MITKEENAGWIQDWHFFDVNNDRYLDAFYSGQSKMRGGYYTYIMLADTGLSYPIKFEASGYIHAFLPDKKGIELTLREDAHGKGYLHKIGQYRVDYEKDTTFCRWQVQMVSTTDVPEMHQPEAVQIHLPTQLRTSSQMLNEPSTDYDQDGIADGAGNVVALLNPQTPCFRFAEMREDDMNWSFVLVLGELKKGHVFKPVPGIQMAYAGWVLTDALGK